MVTRPSGDHCLQSMHVQDIQALALMEAIFLATHPRLSVWLAAYPLLVIVVASCGMAPMARNMMLRKDTPKMAREPVAVLSIPLNRDPMMRDMTTT